LTISEAATALGISPAAVRDLVRSGVLPHHRPTLSGRRVVLAEADVRAHWERTRHQGMRRVEGLTRLSLDPNTKPFGRHP
jgi:excisionase family DNA binding protein